MSDSFVDSMWREFELMYNPPQSQSYLDNDPQSISNLSLIHPFFNSIPFHSQAIDNLPPEEANKPEVKVPILRNRAKAYFKLGRETIKIHCKLQ